MQVITNLTIVDRFVSVPVAEMQDAVSSGLRFENLNCTCRDIWDFLYVYIYIYVF